MSNQLYNILVPVDFTGKNKWAITKAIELSNSFNCNIHLVYVAGKNKSVFFSDTNSEVPLKKLEQLRGRYHVQLCGEGKMEISVLRGNKLKQLANYIKQHEIDLVVTGLSKFNVVQRITSSFSLNRLAKKTEIPVLATRSGGLVCHFKKIVLPVSGEVPMRQIKLAALLGRAFRSKVYLVALRAHTDDKHPNIIDNAMEMVHSISTIPAQFFLLEGKNLAKSTLQFSKKINADLIMVNPIKDFRLPGLWNRFTNKLLSYGSGIPVVIVASGIKHI